MRTLFEKQRQRGIGECSTTKAFDNTYNRKFKTVIKRILSEDNVLIILFYSKNYVEKVSMHFPDLCVLFCYKVRYAQVMYILFEKQLT